MIRPPSPRARMLRRGGPAGVEAAVEIHADEPLPEPRAELCDRLPVAQPGVRDDDVESAHALDGLRPSATPRPPGR